MPRPHAITERDVLQAASRGERAVDASGAVVTPAARDAAATHGITIGTGGSIRTVRVGAGTPATLRVAVGADHGGVALKDVIAGRLRDLGHVVSDMGTTSTEAVDYPDFAVKVAREVSSGRAHFGIMVDGAGIGSCMAANKVRGVRAAMCHDITTAVNAREHNNANMLTLGGGLLGARLAADIVQAFLATPFGGGRHERRVAKIDALDGAG